MKVALKEVEVAQSQFVSDGFERREFVTYWVRLEPEPNTLWMMCFRKPKYFNFYPGWTVYAFYEDRVSFKCEERDSKIFIDSLKRYVEKANKASEQMEDEKRQKGASLMAESAERERRDRELRGKAQALLEEDD